MADATRRANGHALLTAALGFLQLHQESPEVGPLRRWLASWRGLGDVGDGINGQATTSNCASSPRLAGQPLPDRTAHSIVVASAWEPTPWRAVQQAAWGALKLPESA